MGLDSNAIREVHFTYDGELISDREVFRRLSEPFTELIAHNEGQPMSDRINFSHSSNASPRAQGLLQSATRVAQKETELMSATVVYDDCGQYVFRVLPRHNTEDTALKYPSISFLDHPGSNTRYVFREARDYDLDGPVGTVARKAFNGKFDSNHYKTIGLSSSEPPEKKQSVVMIPEATLLLGLEQLYDATEVRRITPKFKITGLEGRTMRYIRNFFDSARDANVGPNRPGTYLGTLHGLGLMDGFDIDPSEYCIQDTGIIHIDPDFITYTASDKLIDDWDLRQAKKTFQTISQGYYDPKGMKAKRRDVRDETRDKMLGDTIWDYLPVITSASPMVDLLAVANFNEA